MTRPALRYSPPKTARPDPRDTHPAPDTPALIAPILASFDQACATARLHAPGGQLFAHDLQGILRRTARLHGCKVDDLKRWIAPRAVRGAEG